MKVYYDSKLSQWYHCYLENTIHFGGLQDKLAYREEGSDTINFDLRQKGNRIGPVVGILTASKKDGSIAGNGPLFVNLQKKLFSLSGISFIFTLKDVEEEWINGYMLLPDKEKWVKVRAPLPDLVYNRIPFRKAEQDEGVEKFFNLLSEKQIPYFNPCFINKMELYQLLTKHPLLKRYLPETIIIQQKKDLKDFLAIKKELYLKPARASRGKGIFRLSIGDGKQIYMEGLKMNETFPTFEHLWNGWEETFRVKRYIAQEKVEPALYEGKRFDLRILAHAHEDDYIVTGVGIRQSQGQDITTHIPAGGRVLPYDLFQSPENDQFIQTIVSEIGKTLSAELGYFGEFSVDAGMDVTGQYYIYEVNSKPMSFDETEIEERKLEKLCRQFLQLTGF